MRFDFQYPPDNHPGFRWSATTQRRFVEVLAETGSVRVAAASVSKTHRAAYRLRGRPDGRWFGVGWDAAIGIARDYMADRMLEAAMGPIEYVGVREAGAGRLSWRRTDATLARGRGMALLRRLDKAAANIAAEPARYRLAYQAQGDFLAFLALLGRGAAEDEYQAFLRSRRRSISTFYVDTCTVFRRFQVRRNLKYQTSCPSFRALASYRVSGQPPGRI